LSSKRIYLSPPHLDGDEKQLLVDAFDSNWITTLGPHVQEFEMEMCHHLGVGHAVALSSGTAALHLALLNLGVQPGDEVICSDFTFAATTNAIRYCQAVPVLVDSDRESWNMDPDLLEQFLVQRAKVEKLPKAAVVVDLYGQPANYRRIEPILEKYGIPLVEDAAEALGATYDGKSAGRFGVMGILSFNGNKIITTSGGGMLVSDNEAYIARARHLATQAREPVPFYEHKDVGYNYRLSNLLAAVGRGQLKNLEKKVDRRREINAFYRKELGSLPGISFMPEIEGGRSTFWLTCILVDAKQFGTTHEDIRLELEKHNIESRHLWKPMHMQPVFRELEFVGNGVSRSFFESGLCLPSGTALTKEDLTRIVEIIRGFSKA